MTLIKKNKKGGSAYPSLGSDFFGSRFFSPSFADMDIDQWNSEVHIPPANISESSKDYKLELSAPGLTKNDFIIEIENGALTVSCEKEDESSEEKENYTRREFSYRSFQRSFPLPDNVREEEINAKYEDGVLRITIPKKEISISRGKKAIKVS
jgi:HSP20 family protein